MPEKTKQDVVKVTKVKFVIMFHAVIRVLETTENHVHECVGYDLIKKR